MSYQVIARKWRPQAFEEVTGQEPITRTLRSAIEHGRIHHAYLFSGARGVGKTTTARLLAKALNCHKSDKPTPEPCRIDDPTACASCREIAEGRSIDVLEIDAASNTGVDSVRDSIINTVGVRPARDRYKVFIIDEVHMLSGAAFNALLKTLEEPPAGVVFIMATTESHKLPDTILSRVQQFEFRTIPTQKIAERLKLIAEAERIEIDDDALREIARAGAGSMRDAQSAFDQTISFSVGEKITTETVEAALGIASSEMLARTVRAVAEQNSRDALAVVDELIARGHDLRNFCRDLLAYLRDLLVVKIAGAETDATDASEAARRELLRAGEMFSESDLTRFFHSLTETEKTLRESLHPRYQLEIGLVKLVEMRRLASLGDILQRLAALEESLQTGGGGSAQAGGAPPQSAGGGFGGNRSSGASFGVGSSAVQKVASGGSNATPRASALNETPRSFALSDAPRHTATANDNAPLDDGRPPFEPFSNAPTKQNAPTPALKLVTPHTVSNSASSVSTAASVMPNDSTIASNVANAAPSFFDPPPQTVSQSNAHSSETATNRIEPMRAVEMHDNSSAQTSRGSSETSTPHDSLAAQIKSALEAQRKPFLATALDGAREVCFDGEDLFIAFPASQKHLRDKLAKPDAAKLLREIAREIAGRDMGLRIVVGDAARTSSDGEMNGAQMLRSAPTRMSSTAQSHANSTTRHLRAISNEEPPAFSASASVATAPAAAAKNDSPLISQLVSHSEAQVTMAQPVSPPSSAVTFATPGAFSDDEDERRREQQRLREYAENHPLVQKALRIFGAEIIEVVKLDDAESKPTN